jgi:DNA-directed RNA polymerase subunit RPC12/RpoP
MSTISFSCPHCAQKFEVPADKAGKKSKCPKCSKPITVPNRPLDLPKPVVIPRAAEAPATVQPQIIAIPVPQYEPEERRINHTHRTKGSFGTGFGLTFGCLMAFLLVSCGGVAFFVFGAGLFTAKVGQTIVNAQEKKEKVERESPRAIAGKETQTVEGLKVFVKSAIIAQVPVDRMGQKRTTQEEYLLIEVELSIADTTKKYEHRSWTSDSVFNTSRAKLTDDVGNKYRLTVYDSLTRVEGVKSQQTVMHGKPANDFIVFEVPVPGANELDLVLDAGDGRKFYFKLPKEFFAKK